MTRPKSARERAEQVECADCGAEIVGRYHLVGFFESRRPVCGACWAVPHPYPVEPLAAKWTRRAE